MTLANGRPYLAIPGPSVMPDRVLNAMHRAAPNIYHGELVEMSRGIVADLKAWRGRRIMRRSTSATAMGPGRRRCPNVLSRGDRALVLATGRFGMAGPRWRGGWASTSR